MGTGELFSAVPRLPANMVPRDRLLRRLDSMTALAVLRTLGGQGATTLVAAWALRRIDGGDQVVWVGPAVEDASGIWTRVHAVHAGHEGRTILVIDNAGLLKDLDFVEVLCGLLRVESRIHAVACGGSLRSLLDVAGRDRIEFSVITGRDLNIDVQEVAAYAEAWGQQVDQEQLTSLHDSVGGNLYPLRLALAKSTVHPDDLGLHAVRDYLQAEVMSRINDVPLLRIASIIALVDVVRPATVAAVLHAAGAADRGAQQVITDLWVMGMLRRVIGSEDEWQFPPLVRESLVGAVTHTDPGAVIRGHRAIVNQLVADRGDMGQVMRHARLGQDWAALTSLWARYTLTLLVEHPVEARFAFYGLPDRVLASQPVLATPEALVTVESGDEAAMVAALRNRRRVEPSSVRSDAEVLDAAATALILHRNDGDVAAALRVAESVATTVDDVCEGTRGAHAWFQLQWGITEVLAADQSAALSRLARLHGTADHPDTAHIAASAAAHLAMIHAMVGANVVAAYCLQLAEAPTVTSGWLASMKSTPAGIARAQLALDRLDQSAAKEAIDVLQWRTHEEMWPCISYVATQCALHFSSAMEVRSWLEPLEFLHARHLKADGLARQLLVLANCDVLLALGEVNRAHALIGPDESCHWWWSRLARVRLMTGDHLGALELASSSAAHPGSSVRAQVDLLMIRVASLHALGRVEELCEAAERAHALADHSGIDSACLRVPAGVCGRRHDHPVEGRWPFPERAELIVLSPREARVLSLMREHETLAAIAKALTVSINTVKKQSVAIHSKLGVRDRRAALIRAESLGLLPPRDVNQP